MSDQLRHPDVLHVVPFDLARGAQRYARSLVDEIGGEARSHQILTLFAADSDDLGADVSLGVPRGLLRRVGLDPRVIVRLRKAIRELGPGVLVAHGGESAKYAALASPRSLPIVYLRIGTSHESLRRPWRRLLHSRYTRRADRVVAVSRDVAEEVASMDTVAESRLSVIPNARDPNVFRPGPQPERPTLLFVGHMNVGKRPERFVGVVQALRERNRDFDALMVGDGPLLETLRASAEAAGVTVLGRRDDVPEIMATADIFVFPSLAPGEGMPGVLIEAGLSGMAVVATRVPGARDVVEDGVTGFLVEIDGIVPMIEAVDRLVCDEDLRVGMGRLAREHCLQRFTMAVTVEMWQRIFTDLASVARSS